MEESSLIITVTIEHITQTHKGDYVLYFELGGESKMIVITKKMIGYYYRKYGVNIHELETGTQLQVRKVLISYPEKEGLFEFYKIADMEKRQETPKGVSHLKRK